MKGAARHGRFPHPSPLPEGEGDKERAARDFHGNLSAEDYVRTQSDLMELRVSERAMPLRFISALVSSGRGRRGSTSPRPSPSPAGRGRL
jgi:hypothetical protein